MVKSLGRSIIRIHLMGAFAISGMSDRYALNEDLESDPFLNSALQRFTCKLYYRFDLFLALLNFGLITSRHYLSEQNVTGTKMAEQMEMSEQPTTPSKYTGFGAAMAAELMIGF